MEMIDTSHYPSADDISFDSLEYLFNPPSVANARPIPWVDFSGAERVVDKHTFEIETRLAQAEEQIQQKTTQLQRVCLLVGYMQGLVHDKDEQLKALPDLRFRAGQSVAYRLETERYRERNKELVELIERLQQHPETISQKILKTLSRVSNSDDVAIEILHWLGLMGISGVLLVLLRGF